VYSPKLTEEVVNTLKFEILSDRTEVCYSENRLLRHRICKKQ